MPTRLAEEGWGDLDAIMVNPPDESSVSRRAWSDQANTRGEFGTRSERSAQSRTYPLKVADKNRYYRPVARDETDREQEQARGVAMDERQLEDRWLSVEEICVYLGVSKDTVYKWIDKKGMPAHRVGRLWKFKKEEVDQWVRSGGADVSPG